MEFTKHGLRFLKTQHLINSLYIQTLHFYTNAQFKNFLQISIGSCFEVETQLIISKELEYISEEELETISKELDSIMKMNHNLQKTL